ncbi:MAG TPA: hypothetical protein VJY41_05160 [Prolixibacteraceae bacterium]|nr:hypothetical protein [Prolixibacteraceae bacterium]
MKHFKFIILILVPLMFGFGCNKSKPNINEITIAEVNGKFLYRSDISNFPIGFFNAKDSIEYINEFITNWIKEQLLVNEAVKNLKDENNEIKKELEKYRQELLIHKYREKKLSSLSQSEIKPDVIETFYNQNLKLFVLDRSIVKVTYIVFPEELELPPNFKKIITDKNQTELADIENFIYSYATKYDDFDENWLYFGSFLQSINYQIDDNITFLNKNKLIEFTRDKNYNLIIINDYLLPDKTAPLEFVAPRIENLILNNKKLDFLREIKDSLYNNALKYNNFTVFN